MSIALTHRLGSDAFSQLARLFNGLKRRGRVIDVMWFQQNAEYARAVLTLADECDDDTVRDMGTTLRQMLGDWVAPPKPVPATAVPGVMATGRTAAVKLSTQATTAVKVSTQEADALPATPVAEKPPESPAMLAVEEEPVDRYVGRLR